MKKRMMLQLFEDGGGAGSGDGQGGGAGTGCGDQGGNAGRASGSGGTYTYEQAEEIASARASKAERSALANYFRSQGMTEQEITQAIHDFKEQRAQRHPDAEKLQKDLDNALNENARLKNENYLRERGVKADDLDYVIFKVNQMVDEKTDFKKAAEKFIKENPRFAGTTYRVSTGSAASGSGGAENPNDSINAAIRRAAGRQV